MPEVKIRLAFYERNQAWIVELVNSTLSSSLTVHALVILIYMYFVLLQTLGIYEVVLTVFSLSLSLSLSLSQVALCARFSFEFAFAQPDLSLSLSHPRSIRCQQRYSP